MKPAEFEMWAVVELMGFRTRAGYVTEVEAFGGKLMRIDIYTSDTEFTKEFYGAAALYGIRPATREECIGLSTPFRITAMRIFPPGDSFSDPAFDQPSSISADDDSVRTTTTDGDVPF